METSFKGTHWNTFFGDGLPLSGICGRRPKWFGWYLTNKSWLRGMRRRHSLLKTWMLCTIVCVTFQVSLLYSSIARYKKILQNYSESSTSSFIIINQSYFMFPAYQFCYYIDSRLDEIWIFKSFVQGSLYYWCVQLQN